VRRPGVRIVSFDDVLRELHFERGRHYGRWEDIGGLAFYSILRVRRGHEHRDRYLFEAEGEDGFRMGVCLKGRSQLVLRVHSPLAGDLEVAAAHVEYDRWSAVSCVIGAADSITLLQIRIDDRLVAEQRVEGFDVGSQLFEHLTIGANRDGENRRGSRSSGTQGLRAASDFSGTASTCRIPQGRSRECRRIRRILGEPVASH
jgi:hypothetical protein